MVNEARQRHRLDLVCIWCIKQRSVRESEADEMGHPSTELSAEVRGVGLLSTNERYVTCRLTLDDCSSKLTAASTGES